MSAPKLAPSRLLPRDVLAVGSIGLRTRKLRAALSAVGVAIGIASMVAVLGISASSQAELLDQIDALGTNLLTVQPGQSFIGGEDSTLPVVAKDRLAGMNGVDGSASLYTVTGATVRRTEFVDERETSGITVYATDTSLTSALSAELSAGAFLDQVTSTFPAVVLGSVAAQRLGITDVDSKPMVWIGQQHYAVVGILKPVTLDSGIDRAAVIGLPEAQESWDADATPAKVYLRTDESQLEDVRALVGATANPQAPEEVEVSRPSDALEAKAAAEGAFTSLLLGLGAVALLVGGVGIANVMVISVIERRSEIGLRRALGATRRHITSQFLTESLLLSAMGGVAGAALGAVVTAIYAATQGQPTVVPPEAVFSGVAAALVIGAIAGLYPSMRAARLSPTEALRTV